MSENINKVWGERNRVHFDGLTEIDFLKVKANTFCSTHTHKYKANKFYLISGAVEIQTEFGHRLLKPGESWEVKAPLKHRFFALEDSEMIEIAYVTMEQVQDSKQWIDDGDINRESQGGRIVNGIEMTLNEMREKGLLDL